jgi:hypothetical protein
MPDPHAPATSEERVAARHRPRRVAPVRFFTKPDYRSRGGALRDLSATGSGVIAGTAVEVGALIFVQLPGRRQGVTCTRAARVVHRTPLSNGEWLLGCRWQDPLPDEEVKTALHAFG